MIDWSPVAISLSALKPWDRNPKRISRTHARRLLELWDRLGQFQTIAIGPSGEVYDGHQRLSVLKAAYGAEFSIRALQSSRPLTEDERAELTIAAHVGTVGQFDWDALSGWDASALQGWGMDAETLGAWRADVAALDTMIKVEQVLPDDPGPQIDKAEELRQKWGTESGQLWQLGEHRVICGDCTDAAVVGRVMGGEKAGCCVTDPPYGINLDLCWLSRANATANKPRNTAKSETVIGDDGSLDVSFVFDFPQWFVWGFPYLFHDGMTGWVVWDKWPGVDGGGLGNPVEMALSNCFTGFRLWRVMWGGYYRDKGEKREPHPTQKPMGVILPAVEMTAGLVYDPFLGSGTTLIACERLGRRCRGIEISPAYVAVTLQRWADMTGQTPIMLDGVG